MSGFSGFSLGGIGAPCCCGAASTCCLLVCSPCAIPQKPLQIAYTNVISGNATIALPYNGTSWATTVCDANGLLYALSCSGGNTLFTATYFTAGSCPTGTQAACSSLNSSPHKLDFVSSTCDPFSLTYSSTSGDCPAVTSSGYTQFVVSDPSPVSNPPGLMCYTFTFVECGIASPSATVEVYASMGGTLVASGTTTNGTLRLWWQGAPGSYYVTANADGIVFAGTLTLACHGTTPFTATVSGICCQFSTSGACPIPSNLTLTDANGSYSFTYDGSTGWYACATATVAGVATITAGPCALSGPASATIPIMYVGTCNVVAGVSQFNVNRWWMGVGFGPSYYVAPTVFSCIGPHVSSGGATGWQVPCLFSLSPSNPFLQVSGLSAVWSACTPFAWSGTLVPSPGEFTSDPVGGTVAVAA